MESTVNFKSELLQQHRQAEAMLTRLADAVRDVRRDGPTAALVTELGEIRRAIQGEVLGHFREEELALFPVLARHLGSSSGPIVAMMEDHAVFRQLELQFEEALSAIEAGADGEWPGKLCSAGEAIGDLLHAHIQKEDGALFPMADEQLTETDWTQITRLRELAQRPA